MAYCPTKKTPHRTKADARREVKRLKKTGAGHPIAYPCDVCPDYHVGHPPPSLIRGEIARSDVRQHRYDRERVLGT